jgi:hypothetical protein
MTRRQCSCATTARSVPRTRSFLRPSLSLTSLGALCAGPGCGSGAGHVRGAGGGVGGSARPPADPGRPMGQPAPAHAHGCCDNGCGRHDRRVNVARLPRGRWRSAPPLTAPVYVWGIPPSQVRGGRQSHALTRKRAGGCIVDGKEAPPTLAAASVPAATPITDAAPAPKQPLSPISRANVRPQSPTASV